MSQRICDECTKEFDQTEHLPRQVECGCVRCEKCLRIMYKIYNLFKCELHNHETNTQIDQLMIAHEYLQSISTSQNQTIRRCMQHQEEFVYYCQDDEVEICIQCFKSHHINHRIVSIQQRIQESKQHLQKIIQETIQKIDQKQKKLNNISKTILQQKNQVYKEITLIYDKVQNQIKQASQTLIQKIQEQLDPISKQMIETNECLQDKLKKIFTIKTGENSLQECDQQIIYLKQLSSSIDSKDYKNLLSSSASLIKFFQQKLDYENHF